MRGELSSALSAIALAKDEGARDGNQPSPGLWLTGVEKEGGWIATAAGAASRWHVICAFRWCWRSAFAGGFRRRPAMADKSARQVMV